MNSYGVRSRFSPRVRVGVKCTEKEGMTKQSMAQECDINFLMARFQAGVPIDHFSQHEGFYGDVPAVSFHEALEIVRAAETAFADLPSAIRERFGHSPEAYVSFLSDPANLAEARKLGLAKPEPGPTPVAPTAVASAPVVAPA